MRGNHTPERGSAVVTDAPKAATRCAGTPNRRTAAPKRCQCSRYARARPSVRSQESATTGRYRLSSIPSRTPVSHSSSGTARVAGGMISSDPWCVADWLGRP